MKLNFSHLTSVMLTITICLCLPISAHAEKKKTTKSKVTQAKKWDKEPTTFLGIKLNEPFNNSVSMECPPEFKYKKDYANTTDVAINLPDGVLCYNYTPSDGYLSVLPNPLPMPISLDVVTDNNTLSGNVERIQSVFFTKDFSELIAIFVAKYGPPHKQLVEKLKTKGGQEFDNNIADWNGKNVSIHMESLISRSATGSTINENGIFYINTKSYLTKITEESRTSIQKSADKL